MAVSVEGPPNQGQPAPGIALPSLEREPARPTQPPMKACPTCGGQFAPRRKDQRFCARTCQKNSARGPQRRDESPEAARRSTVHHRRALDLAELLYTTPRNQRLGFMADLIEATRDHSGAVRNILTDPRLLNASPDTRGLFFRRSPRSYRTISQVADAYCRLFWGHGVREVVHKLAPEPETGEVIQSASAPIGEDFRGPSRQSERGEHLVHGLHPKPASTPCGAASVGHPVREDVQGDGVDQDQRSARHAA